ncbi:hypothetical protein [Pararhodonellum marinum]|uniref:hypothetical protein n=1 Tax=Pararhodonellum marinum TaxID=2755358 RepID=UPI00188FF507|nr:hypothetical protein [Pararhodonellum marinum]
MVIRSFATNPIFFFKGDGNQKSHFHRQAGPPVVGQGCTGDFSLLARFVLNYHFPGIIAHLHVINGRSLILDHLPGNIRNISK